MTSKQVKIYVIQERKKRKVVSSKYIFICIRINLTFAPSCYKSKQNVEELFFKICY